MSTFKKRINTYDGMLTVEYRPYDIPLTFQHWGSGNEVSLYLNKEQATELRDTLSAIIRMQELGIK